MYTCRCKNNYFSYSGGGDTAIGPLHILGWRGQQHRACSRLSAYYRHDHLLAQHQSRFLYNHERCDDSADWHVGFRHRNIREPDEDHPVVQQVNSNSLSALCTNSFLFLSRETRTMTPPTVFPRMQSDLNSHTYTFSNFACLWMSTAF